MTEQRPYLLQKYPQDRPGFAPWHLINTVSECELRADIRIADAVGLEVIGAWLAQALRMRPAMLQVPAGW